MFNDKFRKRGIRIAQKNTYKHHEHDNFAKPYGWCFVSCWKHDSHPAYRGCRGCLKSRYWSGDEPVLDNERSEYLS